MTILARCLEFLPEDRYASARDFADDLRRFRQGEPIQARRIGFVGRAWRQTKNHPGVAAAAITALLVLATSVGWVWTSQARSKRQAALAMDFMGRAKDIEYRLSVERLLPPHDLRPAFETVQHEMDLLQQEMARLGPLAFGPGHFALGRAHLALGDASSAIQDLESAVEHGVPICGSCPGFSSSAFRKLLAGASRLA